MGSQELWGIVIGVPFALLLLIFIGWGCNQTVCF